MAFMVVFPAIVMMTGGAAAFDPLDVEKLKTTNSCPECDLTGANLSGVRLAICQLIR